MPWSPVVPRRLLALGVAVSALLAPAAASAAPSGTAAIDTSLQARVGDSGPYSPDAVTANVGDVVFFLAELRNQGEQRLANASLTLSVCDAGTVQTTEPDAGYPGRVDSGQAITLRCSRTITAADRPSVLAVAVGQALTEDEETVSGEDSLTVNVTPAPAQPQPVQVQASPPAAQDEPAAQPETAPAPVVEASRRPSGLARLLLRRGCRTGQLRLRVLGQGISRVEFFVDGRRRAVIRRANRRGEWRFIIRRLSVSGHRISARVTYSTGKPRQTLRKSVFSCAS